MSGCRSASTPPLPVNDHSVFMLGRLKPGVSLQQAQAELDTLVARMAEASGAAEHHLDPRSHRASRLRPA